MEHDFVDFVKILKCRWFPADGIFKFSYKDNIRSRPRALELNQIFQRLERALLPLRAFFPVPCQAFLLCECDGWQRYPYHAYRRLYLSPTHSPTHACFVPPSALSQSALLPCIPNFHLPCLLRGTCSKLDSVTNRSARVNNASSNTYSPIPPILPPRPSFLTELAARSLSFLLALANPYVINCQHSCCARVSRSSFRRSWRS